MAGTSVAERLAEVLQRIQKTAQSCGRDPSTIELVAVTKTKPLEMIDEAATAFTSLHSAVSRISFGENYVQEATAKIDSRPAYNWNFIGPLQSNKVKEIVGRVGLIHSIDRMKIAREVSSEAVKRNLKQRVLIQIHTGSEETKHGFTRDEILNSFAEISALPGLEIVGLMTLPPLSEDVSVSRGYFRETKTLMDDLSKMTPGSKQLQILSMGTTGDFEAAILEGATHVRVGTAIFGERERRET